jgi:hypothetical protein
MLVSLSLIPLYCFFPQACALHPLHICYQNLDVATKTIQGKIIAFSLLQGVHAGSGAHPASSGAPSVAIKRAAHEAKCMYVCIYVCL